MAAKKTKKAPAKEKKPETVDVSLTEVQVEMLEAAYDQNQRANQHLQLVLSAVLAGENIGRAQVTGFDAKRQVLTILKPESTE